MKAYNDLIALLCEYKINIFRYDAYVRSIIIKQLNSAQKELLLSLASKELGNITKRDLEALVRDMKRIMSDSYERIAVYLNDTDQQFLKASQRIEAGIYNDWLGAPVFSSLPHYKLEAIKYAPLFEGREIGDWWKKQESDIKFKLETIIRNGNVIGETNPNIAKEVRRQMDITKRQADILVRTANSAISSHAQNLLMKENSDIIECKQQLSTLDNRTTDVCRFRDGLKWSLDNKPIGHDVPFRDTPLHFGCRSIIMIIVEGMKISTRASANGQVDGDLNYQEWLKTQPKSEQDRILGKQKAKWFREGKLTLSQMLDQSDRPLTLKQLKEVYGL